jgi:hypothetical protein
MGYVASNSIMTVNDEVERLGKEAVVADLKVVSQHFPGGA